MRVSTTARGSVAQLSQRLGDTAWSLKRTVRQLLSAVILGQGFLSLLVLPLSGAAFQWTLGRAGIDGISQGNIGAVVTNPLALGMLAATSALIALMLYLQIATLTTIAHRAHEARPLTFRGIVADVAYSARALASWQACLFMVYGFVLLPLAHLSIASDLTSHIALPRFISDEMLKTTVGTVSFALATVAITYTAFRLSTTMAVLVRTESTIWSAMKTSVVITRPGQFQYFAGFAVIAALGTAATVAGVLFTALPTVLLDSLSAPGVDAASGIGLACAKLAVFLGGGGVSAAGTAYTVSHQRRAAGMSVRGDRPDSADDASPHSQEHGPSEVDCPTLTAGNRRARAAWSAALAVLVVTAVAGESLALAGALNVHTNMTSTRIIAHRGLTAHAVENSIEALQAAHRAGAHMSELDVQETADGQFVVFHDATLARLAGDSRLVSDLTVAELKGVTIRQGSHTAEIPSLHEYVAEANRLGISLLIELKPTGAEAPKFAERFVAHLEQIDPHRLHAVQSLDKRLIERVSALDPTRETAYVVGLQLGFLPETTANTVAIETWSYSDAMLAQARSEGKQVFAWTVNDPDLIRAILARRVHGIITDEVDSAVTAAGEATSHTAAQRYLDILLIELTPIR